ncbi:MAG: hypothetical protein WCD35_16765 [Mycobacteriales bacterium]
MLLTDDRLVEAMRTFVTASNRLDHLVGKADADLRLLEQVSEQKRAAGQALQEALVQRGWRCPGS